MLSVWDSILLGMVQGITEFLPISSSGHLILAREMLGITQEGGLAFDAMLQLATALAVVLYFRQEILDLVKNLFAKVKDPVKNRLTGFLIVGTVPAVVLGLLIEDYMETLFRSTRLVSLTLVVGAAIMLIADRVLAKRQKENSVEELTFTKSLGIGFFQALALIPGMSRSGMTISGGYFLGIPKDLAVKFSFLLSIPIIVGSGLLKVSDIDGGITGVVIAGFVSAFAFGWLAIDFLLKFLRSNTFTGFVFYRLVLAVVIVTLLL